MRPSSLPWVAWLWISVPPTWVVARFTGCKFRADGAPSTPNQAGAGRGDTKPGKRVRDGSLQYTCTQSAFVCVSSSSSLCYIKSFEIINESFLYLFGINFCIVGIKATLSEQIGRGAKGLGRLEGKVAPAVRSSLGHTTHARMFTCRPAFEESPPALAEELPSMTGSCLYEALCSCFLPHLPHLPHQPRNNLSTLPPPPHTHASACPFVRTAAQARRQACLAIG